MPRAHCQCVFPSSSTCRASPASGSPAYSLLPLLGVGILWMGSCTGDFPVVSSPCPIPHNPHTYPHALPVPTYPLPHLTFLQHALPRHSCVQPDYLEEDGPPCPCLLWHLPPLPCSHALSQVCCYLPLFFLPCFVYACHYCCLPTYLPPFPHAFPPSLHFPHVLPPSLPILPCRLIPTLVLCALPFPFPNPS